MRSGQSLFHARVIDLSSVIIAASGQSFIPSGCVSLRQLELSLRMEKHAEHAMLSLQHFHCSCFAAMSAQLTPHILLMLTQLDLDILSRQVNILEMTSCIQVGVEFRQDVLSI